ncbi:MAG TPA: YciI family protein [Candidatus Polarisedimenticolia bacterium]|nr:YciI family protein [Candidatus Polarisedimenticolia bacterium]
MKRWYVVLRTRGARFNEAVPLEEQIEWKEHAAFMDALVEEGFVVLGGPLEGTRDALLVVHAGDPQEIERRLGADPWVKSGILIPKQISPWRIRLGSLEQKP